MLGTYRLRRSVWLVPVAPLLMSPSGSLRWGSDSRVSLLCKDSLSLLSLAKKSIGVPSNTRRLLLAAPFVKPGVTDAREQQRTTSVGCSHNRTHERTIHSPTASLSHKDETRTGCWVESRVQRGVCCNIPCSEKLTELTYGVRHPETGH